MPGGGAEPMVRKAFEASKSPEVRAKLGEVLAAWGRPFPVEPGEPIRRHRAIRVLERIGTGEAKAVLEKLGKESPFERERREVRAALGRLGKK